MRLLVHGINYAPELVGIGKYTSEMCRWLAAAGHTVKVVTAPPYYPAWKVADTHRRARYARENLAGVEVIRCPLYVPRRPSGAKRILHHTSFAATSTAALAAVARRFRPDVVLAIAPSLMACPGTVLAARVSGATSWLHIQDFEVEAAFGLAMLKGGDRIRRTALGLERRILNAFDVVSSISPNMIARLAAHGLDRVRLYELRNWVDTSEIGVRDRLTPLRSLLSVPEDAIVALYSGSMSRKQGLEQVMAAAVALAGSRPEICFVFCGNGPAREELIAQGGRLTNVRFLDLQPAANLPDLLATADIHLIPQRAEAADLVLPSKLAGCLASGRPVVAMAEPGTQLAAEIEGVGLAVRPGDPAALAAAIVTLAGDRELCARLGMAARAAALLRWERDAIMQRFEAALYALVRSSRPDGAPEAVTQGMAPIELPLASPEADPVRRHPAKL